MNCSKNNANFKRFNTSKNDNIALHDKLNPEVSLQKRMTHFFEKTKDLRTYKIVLTNIHVP